MPSPKWLADLGTPSGRLGDTSGASTSLAVQDPGLAAKGGRLASYALSGASSNPYSVAGAIKSATGFDTEESLPKILSKPIEYLGSPVGLAATAIAPFTGGGSLAALGARTAATRLGASAVTGVVGGVAGETAGTLAARGVNALGGPEWLEATAGVVAGLAAGGGAGYAVAKRIPGGLAAAGKAAQRPLSTTEAYEDQIRDLVTRFNETNTKLTAATTAEEIEQLTRFKDAHLDDIERLAHESASFKSGIVLPHIAEGNDPIHRAANVVKAVTGKGVLANERGTPIVDATLRGGRTAVTLGNETRQAVRLQTEGIEWLRYGEYDKGKAPLINVAGEWKPFQSVADEPRSFKLTSEQRKFIHKLNALKRPYETQMADLQGKQIRLRGSTNTRNGGVTIPRGFAAEDGVNTVGDYAYTKDKVFAKGVSHKDIYSTMEEGLAEGVVYPPLDEAMGEYVTLLAKASVENHVVMTLKHMRDAEGLPLLRNTDDLLPQSIKDGYAKAVQDYDMAIDSIKSVENMQLSQTARVQALQDSFDLTKDPNIKTELDEAVKKLGEMAVTKGNEDLVMSQAKLALDNQTFIRNQAINDVAFDTNLDTIKAFPQLQEMYGPRALTDSINSALQPTGNLSHLREGLKDYNDGLRLFHTLIDLSDYGRLFATAGLKHPFDFFKSIGTGFKSIYSSTAVAQAYRGFNTNLKSAGIPYTMRDIMAYGDLAAGNPDVNLGLLGKIPLLKGSKAESFIKTTSNITQNGFSVMRAGMVTTELIQMKNAGIAIGPEQLAQVSRGVSLLTGSAIHRGAPNASLFIQFPNWMQSQMEFIIHAAAGLRPGASFESKVARNAMIKLLGLGLATTYTVNAIGGKKTEYRNGVPMMRIGDTTLDPFGPYGALARGAYAALDGDVSALLRSRTSPAFQLGWDLMTGRTQNGIAVDATDPAYWARVAAPYTISGANIKQGAELTILQGAGVRANKISDFKQLREAAQEEMGKDWADLTGLEKEALRRGHPDLVAALEEQTIKRAEQGDAYAKSALAVQEINNELLKQQATLQATLEANQLSPVQFREGLNNLIRQAAAQKEQVRKDLGLEDGEGGSDNQKALNQYFDLYTLADRGILMGGSKIGVIDWEVLDRLETELMAKLTPQQQKAVSDRYVVRSDELKWYYENKEVIRNSGYFEVTQATIDQMKPLLRATVPGLNTYTDLQIALYEAQNSGNTGRALRIMALIDRVGQRTQAVHNQMTRKNPLLYKALVQNGYLQQAKTRELVANIQ